jgi:hypothetical protein
VVSWGDRKLGSYPAPVLLLLLLLRQDDEKCKEARKKGAAWGRESSTTGLLVTVVSWVHSWTDSFLGKERWWWDIDAGLRTCAAQNRWL